jgi:molecular chaperone GrpE (heat shock protein)
MAVESKGYFARLFAAVLGREPSAVALEPVVVPQPAAVPEPAMVQGSRELELQSRVAELESELRDRDEHIAQMRNEYADLEASKERAVAAVGQEELERLFKRLSGTLASLSALAAFAEAGQEVELGDLLSLIRSLEKELARAGLEPIGRAGQPSAFDVAMHQRMSGGAVHACTPVTVQLSGYRFGDRVLLKAMVSAAEDTPREDLGNG